jgi:hypothetical protein
VLGIYLDTFGLDLGTSNNVLALYNMRTHCETRILAQELGDVALHLSRERSPLARLRPRLDEARSVFLRFPPKG